jgi:hypothetical protein
MANYRVELTLTGYVDVEANSVDEAREIIENGYALADFYMTDDEIDDVYEFIESVPDVKI